MKMEDICCDKAPSADIRPAFWSSSWCRRAETAAALPQHDLYFMREPQGHTLLREGGLLDFFAAVAVLLCPLSALLACCMLAAVRGRGGCFSVPPPLLESSSFSLEELASPVPDVAAPVVRPPFASFMCCSA